MIPRRQWWRRWLRRFGQAESGAVAAEFVIVFPLFVMVLFSSLEAGLAMTRLVLLERALDLTVRDLRIGALGAEPEHDDVRQRFCAYSMLIPDCQQVVKLEMRLIDRVSWSGFGSAPTCVDRTVAVEPVLEFSQGGTNDIVTIRACAVTDPLFPTTNWGLRLPLDASGGFQIAAMSAFVNEPR